MPLVWIPPPWRDLTKGEEKVTTAGSTVRQVIDHLEVEFPGLRAKMCDGENIRQDIALVVDGITSFQGMRQPVDENSQVHFLPLIRGGCYAETPHWGVF